MRVSKKDWVAMQNRLEYLKDKADRQDKELDQYKSGLEELQKAYEDGLKELAMRYGGKVEIPMAGALGDYDIQVTLVKKAE